jgi:hypothetical protein
MRLTLLAPLAVAACAPGIDAIPWLPSGEAFRRARDPATARWVLIYRAPSD